MMATSPAGSASRLESERSSRTRRAPLPRHGATLALGVALVAGVAGAGEISQHAFPSPSLGREYRYSLYLPDGYGGGGARYPVLYLLHGASGDENEWPDGGDVRSTADRLIADGEIPPLIVVMPGHPDGWWVDGNHEPAATVVLEELIPWIDSSLRTIARREGRLLGGLSAGGYGTVNLALDHPRLFVAVAALSPAVYTPLPPGRSGARRAAQFSRNGAFDPDTWRRLSYEARFERYTAGAIVVPFYLLSGDHDDLGIALQTARLFERLRLHQPDRVELRIVDGGHDWAVWRAALPDALRYLCRFVAREEPP